MKKDKLYDYTFCKSVIDVLKNSGIHIDSEEIAQRACSDSYSDKAFMSFIEDLICNYARNFVYPSNFSIDKLKKLIIDIKFAKDSFEITTCSDLEIFKAMEPTKIDLGNQDSLIVCFDDCVEYRMTVHDKSLYSPGPFVRFNFISNHLANSYEVSDLLLKIKNIITPVLEFDHGSDLNDFMHSEFSKLLPFNDHSWTTSTELRILENWEYCLNINRWRFTRDSSQQIISMFIENLTKYLNDPTSPPLWNEKLAEAIYNLKAL